MTARVPDTRVISEPATKTSLYIVGFAPSWSETPWATEGAEFWGLNNLHKVAPDAPWSAWFQLHDIDRHHPDDKAEHIAWLIDSKLPVFMWEKHIAKYRIPNTVPYPLKDIVTKFGTYFNNTVSWELALAILIGGYKKISVYGVDMATACVAPETRILTADLQWLPAEKLAVGDKVLGFDEAPTTQRRQWRLAEVEEAHEIFLPSYRIHLDNGESMVASADHLWLTYSEHVNRWRRTDQLLGRHHRPNRPTRLTRVLHPWQERQSWEAGYLSAAFDGEGHLSRNNIGFAQRSNAMSERVETLLTHFGYRYSWNQEAGGTRKYHLQGGKVEALRFLGEMRPPRLLDRFDPAAMGSLRRVDAPAVIGLEDVGVQPVVALKTSTKTFIAEGYATHNSEYGHQRPSCEFFLGWAAGLGIEIEIPDSADLLKAPYLYGLHDEELTALQKKMRARVEGLKVDLARHEEIRNNAQTVSLQLRGAIEDSEYYLNTWAQEASNGR